jgi:hypothetical protein
VLRRVFRGKFVAGLRQAFQLVSRVRDSFNKSCPVDASNKRITSHKTPIVMLRTYDSGH